MKTILLAIVMALGTSLAYADGAEKKETKRVCVDVKGKDGKPEIDKKTGKTKQSCKEVKQHKKLEVQK